MEPPMSITSRRPAGGLQRAPDRSHHPVNPGDVDRPVRIERLTVSPSSGVSLSCHSEPDRPIR